MRYNELAEKDLLTLYEVKRKYQSRRNDFIRCLNELVDKRDRNGIKIDERNNLVEKITYSGHARCNPSNLDTKLKRLIAHHVSYMSGDNFVIEHTNGKIEVEFTVAPKVIVIEFHHRD